MAGRRKEKERQKEDEEYLRMSTKDSDIFRTPLKTIQKPIVNFLREQPYSIVTGAAGTGKDFICLYRALQGLIKKEFDHIYLFKPLVESGKSMGFLPGEESDKTSPYEASFYDLIVKLVGKQIAQRHKSKVTFEPANFVRGKSLGDDDKRGNVCVIVTEAQNYTLHELMTVVTRLSEGSKMFINGDPYQADIRNSGLKDFIKITENIEGVEYTHLGDDFQMRNPLIVEITKAHRKFLKE